MKRKFLSFTVLFCLSLFSQGQVLDSRWQAGFFFMPAIAYNYETSGEIDFTRICGLKAEKALSHLVNFRTGITYYKINLYHGIMSSELCSTPTSTCYWCSERAYLEIPLALKGYYTPKKGKINPYYVLGLETAFSIRTKDIRLDESGQFTSADIFENDYITYQQNNFSFALGTEFQFTERLEFCLEPTFKHSIQALWGIYDFNPTTVMGLICNINYKL